MELIDESGKPLRGKSKAEIKDILSTIRPKNKEQEVLLAREIMRKIERERISKINEKIKTGFDGTFKENLKQRKEGDGFSKERHYRMIASIPSEMVYVAMQVWGPNVLSDKKLFRQAFVQDETGQYCLTVDPKTI